MRSNEEIKCVPLNVPIFSRTYPFSCTWLLPPAFISFHLIKNVFLKSPSLHLLPPNPSPYYALHSYLHPFSILCTYILFTLFSHRHVFPCLHMLFVHPHTSSSAIPPTYNPCVCSIHLRHYLHFRNTLLVSCSHDLQNGCDGK